MPKPPGMCMFCGEWGVSKEHIWAKWLKAYVPQEAGSHVYGRGWKRGRDSQLNVDSSERTGSIHSRKLNIACATCNSGWMSRLQEKAKPILIPMLKDEVTDFDLGPDSLKTLAAWATMFTMVVEFADTTTAACTFEERHQFSQDQLPQKHWMMWMGLYSPTPTYPKPWDFYHYGWALTEVGPDAANIAHKCQAQTTTFIVGPLVFHTYSTRVEMLEIDPVLFAVQRRIRPLWPIPPRGFHKLTPIGTHDLNGLAIAQGVVIAPNYPLFLTGDEDRYPEIPAHFKANLPKAGS